MKVDRGPQVIVVKPRHFDERIAQEPIQPGIGSLEFASKAL